MTCFAVCPCHPHGQVGYALPVKPIFRYGSVLRERSRPWPVSSGCGFFSCAEKQYMQHWGSTQSIISQESQLLCYCFVKNYRFLSTSSTGPSNSCYHVDNRIRLFHQVVINLPSTACLTRLYHQLGDEIIRKDTSLHLLVGVRSRSNLLHLGPTLKVLISKH